MEREDIILHFGAFYETFPEATNNRNTIHGGRPGVWLSLLLTYTTLGQSLSKGWWWGRFGVEDNLWTRLVGELPDSASYEIYGPLCQPRAPAQRHTHILWSYTNAMQITHCYYSVEGSDFAIGRLAVASALV